MTYAAPLITLELLGFSTTETSLVYKVRKVLLHEFIDLCDGSLEAFFRLTCYVEIQWRILRRESVQQHVHRRLVLTTAVAMVLSG